jgi:hypothetical protein
VPYCGRWNTLSAGQRAVNVSHAKIRALGAQAMAMATLKAWRLLRKLRCSTTRITGLVQASLALHLHTSNGGWKRLIAFCMNRSFFRAPDDNINQVSNLADGELKTT